MKVSPILLSDSYKQFHYKMYPDDLEYLYSNMTPRKSRLETNFATFFGLQYYIKEYLIDQWNELFFNRPIQYVLNEYERFHAYFSFAKIDTNHIERLHNLGYLPLKIKALPEGSSVPMRVPFFTITNTVSGFGWLVNFLETAISSAVWDLITVATISKQYRELFDRWATLTVGSTEFVKWQGHDFSMRGRSSIETTFNQSGHLLYFTGSDTIPAVLFLEKYYRADMEKQLIASSVPATEHSVMMTGGKDAEIKTFERLLDLFPTGILSVVSDTWNLWQVCTEFLPKLKDKILAREGKLVIRPDSGDPVDIICGNPNAESIHEQKGVVELLWEVFGGTINKKGYKELNPHIGVIYGDSITLERAEQICDRLEKKKFASTNWVAGIGSYTFNYNTRDTLGIAIKATHCARSGVNYDIFKDPITDDGVKKSAKGRIVVYLENNTLVAYDQVSAEEEKKGLLQTVFLDGKLHNEQNLEQIRNVAKLTLI